jgi:prepilin-type N-terminal cleavage/methylation domain-containing protein
MTTTTENPLPTSTSTRGFTITELMVAMAITAIVVGQLMLVMTTQNRSYSSQERILDAQQDARIATELILSDIRMAGFLVPAIAGLSSGDGGVSAPDRICTSDPAVIAEARIAATNSRFDRATTTAAVGPGVVTVTLLASTMDIDNDGDNDFAVDSGVIISDGTGTHCARVEDITGNVVTFTPRTPGGFAAAVGTTRVVPAVIYEVGANGLARNSVMLSTLVENIQIEFGVDANGNLLIDGGEFPIDSIGAAVDPSSIITARLSLIARTQLPEASVVGTAMSASANHLGGADDGFRRRRFTANVFARNLQ